MDVCQREGAHSVPHISASVTTRCFFFFFVCHGLIELRLFFYRCETSLGAPTCHQGALRRALLHEHHVLKQWTVCAVPARPRSALGQVRGQVAAGEERRAEGERRLQTSVLLRRRHLEEEEGGG